MIPPPPRSTLFPYTTLFRSKGPPHFSLQCPNVLGSMAKSPRAFEPPTDRKSTRLNSSHRCISYAVFCLKKKKKKKSSPRLRQEPARHQQLTEKDPADRIQ